MNHSLPVVTNYEEPLLFKEWKQGDEMTESSVFKVLEPSRGKVVQPQILIVPLMGFQDDCHRIGYGKGFFDRSILSLKELYGDQTLFIGVAFEAQKFDKFTGKMCGSDPWKEDKNTKISKMRAKFKESQKIQWITLDTDEALDYIVSDEAIYKKTE